MILQCVCSLKNLNRSHLQLKRAHSLGYDFSMDLTFSLQYIHLLLRLQWTIFASYMIEKSFSIYGLVIYFKKGSFLIIYPIFKHLIELKMSI